MEVLKDFGVNPILLIAQIINFLIILFILKRFMYKPILSIIKKRENEIKKSIIDSEAADKKLEVASEKEKQILQKAQEKGEKIVSDARLEAEEARKKIEEQTKREAQRLLDDARITIEREEKEAEERLTRRIGAVAISLLRKSLTGIFGEREQRIIVKKAAGQLRKSKQL